MDGVFESYITREHAGLRMQRPVLAAAAATAMDLHCVARRDVSRAQHDFRFTRELKSFSQLKIDDFNIFRSKHVRGNGAHHFDEAGGGEDAFAI